MIGFYLLSFMMNLVIFWSCGKGLSNWNQTYMVRNIIFRFKKATPPLLSASDSEDPLLLNLSNTPRSSIFSLKMVPLHPASNMPCVTPSLPQCVPSLFGFNCSVPKNIIGMTHNVMNIKSSTGSIHGFYNVMDVCIRMHKIWQFHVGVAYKYKPFHNIIYGPYKYKILNKNKILAPRLYTQRYDKNFIEIEDFGNETVFKTLKKKGKNKQ